MTVEIRTTELKPLRNTFSHVARRLGADKPASRYQEATFDLQSDTNFHYRPLWDPEHELYDRSRTAIRMQDWYAFKDPRQFYYGTYVLNRAKLQETTENNFDFVEKHGALMALPKGLTRRIRAILLPLRHYEWGANTNNCAITAYGWGSAYTQATMFCTMDRLAIAQYLSRIGLMLDGGTGTSLGPARTAWLESPDWQPLRQLVEDTFVVRDWFELLIVQDFVMDGLLYPMVYQRFGKELSQQGAAVVAMLTEFMDTWYAEQVRWVDAAIKMAVVESPENRAQVQAWVGDWTARARTALQPLAQLMYFDEAAEALDEATAALAARASKIGIELNVAEGEGTNDGPGAQARPEQNREVQPEGAH